MEERTERALVDVDPSFPSERLDANVEACIYFCAMQAIQNIMRHATNAPTTARRPEEAVVFSVRDDGPGFDVAETPAGTGRAIMRDRVEALGGALTIRSAPGRVPTVEGRVPARVAAEATR